MFILSHSSRVQLFATPQTIDHQALLFMGFFRKDYWSCLPLPSPGHVPGPETEPMSPESSALAGRFFTTESPGKSSEPDNARINLIMHG